MSVCGACDERSECLNVPHVLNGYWMSAGSLQWAGDEVDGGAEKHSSHPQAHSSGMPSVDVLMPPLIPSCTC